MIKKYKYFIAIIIIIFGVFGYLMYRPIETQLNGTTSTPSEVKCDFSKAVNLRKTVIYGITGNDEFDTIVCGYLVNKKRFPDDSHLTAFFDIVNFYDDGFRRAIDEMIAKGNNVNNKNGSNYEFSLGCFEDGKIVGKEYEKNEPYIDNATQKKLIGSSSQKLVSIILSFGKHQGSECECCNFAHKIRLY